MYRGIEIFYKNYSDMLYGGIENWLSPMEYTWPYALKALKRGYSQIF